MNTEDKIITFESYYDPMLAHIIRSRLEANGIPCFIADENALFPSAFYLPETGGIKLKIFERDLERCREILAEQGDMHEQDHYEMDSETHSMVVCPFCGSTNVNNISEEKDEGRWPVIDSMINLVQTFQGQTNWRCNNCQREFE